MQDIFRPGDTAITRTERGTVSKVYRSRYTGGLMAEITDKRGRMVCATGIMNYRLVRPEGWTKAQWAAEQAARYAELEGHESVAAQIRALAVPDS